MHLDLQTMINYIVIGIVVFFIAVFTFSVLFNKIVTARKKKQGKILQKRVVKQYYSSSKVHTVSVPENFSIQNPPIVSFDQKPKHPERFTVVNEPLNRNSQLFSYKSWN